MGRRLLLALAWLGCSTAAAAEGLLCVSGTACRSAAIPAAVEAADRGRTFVWKADDARMIVFGTIAAGGSVAQAGGEGGGARLMLTSTRRERVAAPAVVILHGADGAEWPPVTLTAAGLSKHPVLRAAPGKYVITIAAERHRPVTRAVVIAAAVQDLRIVAEPLPQLTGRVVAAGKNEPVPGATLVLDDRPERLPVAPDGRFELDLDPDQWPSTVRIAAPGYGEARLGIPKARVSADLADVVLAPGASVLLRLDRPQSIGDIVVSLYERRLRQRKETPVATRRVLAGAGTVRFDGLAAGDYALLIRGKEATEQWGTAVSVSEGEVFEAAAELEPRPLLVRVRLRGEPLSRASISLRHVDGMWRGVLHTGEDGVATGTIWQGGDVTAFVEAPHVLTSAHVERSTLSGDEEVEWTIDVPTRSVSGRIIDAATGRGIANANVQLRVEGAQNITVLRAADAEGSFELLPVPPGTHALSAAADGYVPGTKRYEFSDGDSSRVVELALRRATDRRVLVRDARGGAIAGAAVLDFADGALTGRRVTDAAGEVSIPIPANGRRTIFVVPRDEAFVLAPIGSGGGPVTVTASPGVATLRIRVQKTDRTPLEDVWLRMRFEGTLLPPDVQQALAAMQGSVPVSGRDGMIVFRNMPAGLYEIWPLGARTAGDAPLRIEARSGENAATLTFEPR